MPDQHHTRPMVGGALLLTRLACQVAMGRAIKLPADPALARGWLASNMTIHLGAPIASKTIPEEQTRTGGSYWVLSSSGSALVAKSGAKSNSSSIDNVGEKRAMCNPSCHHATTPGSLILSP